MSIHLNGKISTRHNLRYYCEITAGGRNFVAFNVNNNFEVEISENGKIVSLSKWIRPKYFVGSGSILYSDVAEAIQCRLSKAGFLQFKTIVSYRGKVFVLPFSSNFTIEEPHIHIKATGGSFEAEIDDEEDLMLAVILSHFCWMRQRQWENSI